MKSRREVIERRRTRGVDINRRCMLDVDLEDGGREGM